MTLVRIFESEEELREEHRLNLVNGGLRVPAADALPMHTHVDVTLRGPHGAEAAVSGTVVAALPGAVALMIEANADELLARLLEQLPVEEAAGEDKASQNAWDRMRGLSQMEKILLAVKAGRSERALLLQDNDPRVLLSLLRNPRLTIDEVARLAKSPFLNFTIADAIVKTAQWMASLDVRLGLVQNSKTPPAFAMRILPTLPVTEIRNIARAGTSMALKQAALRMLQGK